jgi:hypothetical protein
MSTSTEVRAGSRVGHRLAKAPTGIRGFDEITDGGLPRVRPTLGRRLPEPIRKIIGNLSDTEKVLVGLQLRPEGGQGA